MRSRPLRGLCFWIPLSTTKCWPGSARTPELHTVTPTPLRVIAPPGLGHRGGVSSVPGRPTPSPPHPLLRGPLRRWRAKVEGRMHARADPSLRPPPSCVDRGCPGLEAGKGHWLPGCSGRASPPPPPMQTPAPPCCVPHCLYRALEGLRGCTVVCVCVCVHLGLLHSRHWQWGGHSSPPISSSPSAGQEVVQV